jgi:alpha-N-acetylglucosamine transferase
MIYIKILILLSILLLIILIINDYNLDNNLNNSLIIKLLLVVFTYINYLLLQHIDKKNKLNKNIISGGKEFFNIEENLDNLYNKKSIKMQENKNYIKPNAYLWLLMKGDNYLPGIMVSMYSVLRTKTKNDLVVMTTPDVSEEAKNNIKKLGKIVEIDYIEFKIADIYSEKQKQTYSSWMDVAFTKWNCLKLIEYNKVLLIDADAIILDNIDHLFNLETPAAPFNTSYLEKKYINQINKKLENRKLSTFKQKEYNGFLLNPHEGKFGPDNYLMHGEIVTPNIMRKILYYDNNSNKKTMSLVASTILLSPSIDDFNLFIDMMKNMQPFGFKRCSSAVDEQSISYFYSFYKKQNWTNIHHRYNLMGWKKDFLHEKDFPYVIHYVSDKPWKLKHNHWEDIICWYKLADELLNYLNVDPENIGLNKKNIEGIQNTKDIFIQKLLYKLDNLTNLNNIDKEKISCLDIIGNLNIDK